MIYLLACKSKIIETELLLGHPLPFIHYLSRERFPIHQIGFSVYLNIYFFWFLEMVKSLG